MVARARRKLLGRFRQGVYHCTARCVRQMFLCGWDPLTGRDYSYRRGWIIQREEQLAGLFAIDIEFRAELRTHLHLVLRTMPEVARRWSLREVALRWLTATRLAKSFAKALPQVDEELIDELVKDKKQIERLRRRLASVSWFMGFLCENVARRANAEEDRVGHFWQARFRCRECTDKNAVLLCGIYVDLNLIRAGEADSLESSPYTSIFQRLQARNQPKDAFNRADGWLGELTWDVSHEQDASRAYYWSRTGRRAFGPGPPADQAGGLCPAVAIHAGVVAVGSEDDPGGHGGDARAVGHPVGGVVGDRGALRRDVHARGGVSGGDGGSGPADAGVALKGAAASRRIFA